MKAITSLIQNAYGGLSRSVWLLSLTQLINRAGTMVVFFLAVYLKDELHYDYNQVGIVMSMFGAGSLLGVFVGGKLADKIGYFPVMVMSLAVGGLLFLLTSQIDHFPMLCVGMFLLSAFGEAFRPAAMVAIAHYSDKDNYTRSISLYRLALNLGFAVGPALGGFLAAINYRLIFWADGITCIAGALMVLFFLKKTHDRERNEIKESVPVSEAVRSAYSDKAYLFFLPILVLYAMSFFQFFTTMSLYYKNEALLSEEKIGLLFALNGLIVAAVEMIMIYKIEKKGTVFNWIMLGGLLLLISYVLMMFIEGYAWLIVITVIISFSEMFAMPFMNTFMNKRSVHSNKGQYASLYVMSWSVAQILTPLIATQIIDHRGYPTLWIVYSILSLMVIIGIFILQRKLQSGKWE